jgi:phosphopantothenoylcysteine synthetase/decarboxylase
MDKKTIVLGVSGSIAAHKAIDLASQLTKAGCVVDVVLTRDAEEFVKPLPFQTLTCRRVITSLYDEEETNVAHVRAAAEADLLLLAPVTANTLARLANGLADDALGCIALALRPEAQLLLAPAMNVNMWRHPATVANVAVLTERGAEIIGPDEGMLSCGYEGIGRLWPVNGIAERALELLGVARAND